MRIGAFALTVLASSTAYAASWPSALTYKGQPITRCLEALPMEEASRSKPLDLAACSAPDPQIQDSEPNQDLISQGFIGRSYTTGEGANPAYGYYKVLGPYRGGYLVYGLWSGGGLAQFSSLDVIKRKGDTIWVEREIASGDRCNNGITEAWLERGKLFYKVNFTPYDIIVHADIPVTVKTSDDLESTPTSCFATATFAQSRDNQPDFYVMALNQENPDALISDVEWTRNYRYQTCFNTLFLDALQSGSVSFDKKALTAWVKGFYETCVNQKVIDEKPFEVNPPEPTPQSIEVKPMDAPVEVPMIYSEPDSGVDQGDGQ